MHVFGPSWLMESNPGWSQFDPFSYPYLKCKNLLKCLFVCFLQEMQVPWDVHSVDLWLINWIIKRNTDLWHIYAPGKFHWCTCPKTQCNSVSHPALWAPAPPQGPSPWLCIWEHRGCLGGCTQGATHGTDPGTAHLHELNTAGHESHRHLKGTPAGHEKIYYKLFYMAKQVTHL